MLSRERVIDTIEGRTPDRMPIYGWLGNLAEPITERFGSIQAFEDAYEFDFAHLFGGPYPYWGEKFDALREEGGGTLTPAQLLTVDIADVNEEKAYDGIRQGVAHYKTERGRFVFVQTPGIFECLNGPFRIQDHLLYMALYEEDLHGVYERQAQWNTQFAMNCLDLGVDMIHVSDDWGAQNGLMFAPEMWERLIRPYHKTVCDAVKDRKAYLSLHSDGNISQVLDGIVELGYDVLHPFQESAGMSFDDHLQNRRGRFTIMGGLDVQTTIGFGDYDKLRSEIERVTAMFRDGGMLFCTSHSVQEHCSIEELVFAYDLVYDLVRAKPAAV